MLFHACLLALSHSGRHESTTAVCTLLLCAGPIEGCPAVPAVRRNYGFRSLVCASWCSEEEKQVKKQKVRCLFFVFLGGHIASSAYDTASIVSKKSTSPAVIFTSRLVLPSAMTWTEKSACVANLPHLNSHARASCCLLLLRCCCCIAVGSGAATTTAADSLVLSHHL